MTSVWQKPSVRPWILAGIAIITICIFSGLLYHVASYFFTALRHNDPLITFDTKAMTCPGAIVVMLFLLLMAYGEWRYSFYPYKTQRLREDFNKRLSRVIGAGMLVGLLLAFGAPFLVFNPLLEKIFLTDNGYVQCPNQIQLSRHGTQVIWVKQQSWCFDDGLQQSLGFHSTMTPNAYLRHLQAKSASSDTQPPPRSDPKTQ